MSDRPYRAEAVVDLNMALQDADIVSAVTLSHVPLIERCWLKPSAMWI
ncbi:hypothetical protein [Bartonella sp. DGB2]